MADQRIATISSAPVLRGASTDELDATYQAAAVECLRGLVTKVPGSGQIRGLWMYNGVTYAFRDDEAGATCQMYKSTATGWEKVVTGVTLLPGGRYEFITYNFYGNSSAVMMYGVDGKNKGFQFDGTTYTEITTGMTVDTPRHIYAHQKQLFFSFAGGSVQHSAPGAPLTWSVILGAAELAIGQECVGFAGVPGDALAILGRNTTLILKGTSVADWTLTTLDDESGAIEWSIQRFKQPTYLDDRGVTNLNAVQEYGDFKSATLTQHIQTVIKSITTLVVSSLRVREKDQYRLHLSDGRILTMGLDGRKLVGATILKYPVTMVVTESIENEGGAEILLGGCTEGYVYRLDSGTSFDGSVVDAYIRPAFNHFNSPEHKKRFFRAVLELDAGQTMDMVFLPIFGYGDPNLPSAADQTISVIGGGGVWDSPDTFWREFYWDSQLISTAEAYIDGVGKNLSLFIRSSGTYEKPHTIQGIIIHYSLRGVDR